MLNLNENNLKDLNELLKYTEFYLNDTIKTSNKFVGNKTVDNHKLNCLEQLQILKEYQIKITETLINRG
tara:strand:- start:37 stop:243 length:207 start_codon:yes stop_codon:yes gene_type:complete